MLFTFIVFLYAIFRDRNIHFHKPKSQFLENKWAFLAAALIVGIYFLLQETFFKITMDEVVLASTSMHMHLEKEVFTVSRGYEVNGVFHILGGYLDKRPYFFAFIVSLVHDLFGYRSSNVFYVNAVVSFSLLMGVYFTGKLFGGKRWGWLAILLLVSVPLFGFNVNGGGFELFNLLMLLVTVYLGKCWVEKPTSTSLTAFVFSTLLLAQCRYESILFVFPAGFVILFVWWRDKKVLLPWPVYFAPLILVPYVLQNRVLNDSKVLWQLEENQPTAFGLGYLSLNLKSAADFFFHMGLNQGNSLIIVGFTLVAILLGILYKFHYSGYFVKEKTAWRMVGWIFGLTVCFNFSLLMFYYWGQLSDPVASRLGLPLHLVLVFFAVYVFSRQPWGDWLGSVALVCTLTCIWFFALPNISQSSYMRLAYEARQIDWMNEMLENHSGNVLVITDYHIMGLSNRVSAVPILLTISRKPELEFHIKNQTFSEILLVHRNSSSDTTILGNQELLQLSELEKHFNLEQLYSRKLGPNDVALISRVSGLKMSESENKVYREHVSEVVEGAAGIDYDPTIYFSKWLP